ncbi:chemotaxis protein CheA [Pseudomonas sp. 5P_3.1_Bac2]|uniref:chemotaxis protein CheA n=1 Tax=Pseudomonas sp. 5P_3.1_Bac2 TaxID=2971617 RepID=UPI0021C82D4B|nr:chemotaxis protein CheA [Pseudomonas sp. 5P_3.1_Bac2]MCU1719423.1 chemotaxis protein CheA [Pseudomonas sp. 5P_3.1_Bac2]
MNLDQARAILVQEARELLAEMDAALLQIESGGYDREQINAVFRAAHTIKGSAGIFALDGLVGFTHVLESLLEQVRAGHTALDGRLLSLLLRCGDYIGSLVTAVEQSQESLEPNPLLRAQLLEELQAYLTPAPATVAPPAPVSAAPTALSGRWHISLRPYADVLRNGLDPLSFLRYLSKLGRIVSLHTLSDNLPEAQHFDAEASYLGYEIEFETSADQAAIEAAFEFIRDDSLLLLLAPHSSLADYERLLSRLPEPRARLAQILHDSGAITAAQLQRLLAQVEASAGITASAGPKQSKPGKQPRGQEQLFVKVEVCKLDELINLVGELVIAGAAASLSLRQGSPVAMQQANEVVTSLVEEIRDVSLSLRMVAVGEVFQRLPRVVRDLSKELDKDVELLITGADTELDKSMVERLAEPLLHIVRNALDHGIERAAQRVASGKRARGVLRLNAYHESGSIVIEVSDDGRGLDRQRIAAKAIEQGLLAPEQNLSDSELYRLIFAAGFSTAEEVTNLSGRGVGMDVVRSHIERLRGEVEVLSQPGQGTTVRIRLPLTLAIIDGFQVRVADEAFVLPLEQVVECVDLGQHRDLNDLLNLRGEPLPFVRLRSLFGLTAPAGGRESLVVVQFGNSRAGVVVDQLLGELQAVIKPLGHIFAQNKLLSGSTILGDGSVALILDVGHLIQRAVSRAEAFALSQSAAGTGHTTVG